jgi:hypothetical protein
MSAPALAADSEGKNYQWDVNRVEAIFAALPCEKHVLAENMDVSALKAYAKKRNIDVKGTCEKADLVARVQYAKHDECGICLAPFLEHQWIKTTWCGHQFHWACLGEACLTRASTASAPRTRPITCPYCAKDLKKLAPSPSTGSHKRARTGGDSGGGGAGAGLFANFFGTLPEGFSNAAAAAGRGGGAP